jgi:hypothetical protein
VSGLRTISFGGGVQSVALQVLAAQRRIDFPVALYANVGDDSEHPDTVAYIEHIAKPYAAHHGIQLIEVQRTIGGEPDTILGKILRTAKSEVIPVRTRADGPPMSRSCTVSFKIEALGRWLTDHGASEATPATVAVGFSLDEIGRAGRPARPYEHIVYPLLGMGTPLPEGHSRALRRVDCEQLIAAEPLPPHIGDALRGLGPETLGVYVWPQLLASDFTHLPIPRKSSCWFCPFHSYEHWQSLRQESPGLFEQAVDLEEHLSRKAGSPRYLTRYGLPLQRAINAGVDPLPFPDPHAGGCTSGVCAT